MGSGSLCVQPLISFLGTLLRDLRWRANVSSLLEASAGHWPSGWQAQVGWPPLHYTGIDILPEMVEENRNFSRQRGLRSIGLKSMSFEVMDMTREALPVADVLLTKDTLIHFTNEKIMRFLSLSVLVCPRRYRYVIFVHNQIAPETERAHDNNRDFSYSHSRHPFQTLDMSKAPFNLATKSVFAYLPGTATADGLKLAIIRQTCRRDRSFLLARIQEGARRVDRAVSSLCGLTVGLGLASLSAFACERLQRLQQLQLKQLQQQKATSETFAEPLVRRLIRKNSRLGVAEAYTFPNSVPLGTGTFGVVFLAKHNRTGIERAIKRINKQLVPDPQMLSREVEALKLMDHPHVCRLVEYFETSQHMWLVTELCRGEELCDRLLNMPSGLAEAEVARLTEQMLQATSHVHQRSVLHRDLKPENFLFVGGRDEGTSSSSRSTATVGTLMYMSPQQLRGEPASRSDDVWSLGVIVHILLTGQFPFSTNDDRRFQEMSDRGLLRKDVQEHLAALRGSPQAVEFVQKLLAWESEERISVEDALQHPFLSNCAGEQALSPQEVPLSAEDVYQRCARFSASCRLRRIVMAAWLHLRLFLC
ncbi:unnamed protein product [Polarella glacialis]|uniref:non-specific serine/threonine protein kinase n=1 Tax=Polarella glacialis TaxID=89957 RepID=A0A813DQY6_POLGL|nr:unnamed protein product [Polarella glacialis]